MQNSQASSSALAPTAPALDGRAESPTIFEEFESEVRIYCRKFSAVFTRAKGAELYTEDGRVFIDFFCGAGALNYGHNPASIKQRVVDYLLQDGIMHGLDMKTAAKRAFMTKLHEIILRPRGLDYKIQFCGPTGTNAVEAALKLAFKVTGRRGIISFAGAYHGMSRGSLEATGSRRARAAGGVSSHQVTFVPYEDGPLGPFDSIGYIERLLDDPASGVDVPAAIILEPLQMDGGIYVASPQWLQRLRALTQRHGILLICDEIQSGCGRTGRFFCFEHSGIVPDIVTLSKSISGYGFPMSLVLFRRELDVWKPGEHTGTFRGNQLAFIAAAAALELWEQPDFLGALESSSARLGQLAEELRRVEPELATRGKGMTLGIDVGKAGGTERAERIQQYCFDHGLILELVGRHDEVLKVMPPLNIEPPGLEAGIDVLRQALLATRQGQGQGK